VHGLAALGQSPGPLLVPIVIGKLPPDVRKSLSREHNSLEWTLDQLREAIVTEIRILEAGAFAPTFKLVDHHSPTVAASLLAGTTSQSDSKKPKCAFCKGAHSAI